MKKTIEIIGSMLQRRGDFQEATICCIANDGFIRAQFSPAEHGPDVELVIHPLKSRAGHLLRVCNLRALTLEAGTDAARLCQLLTKTLFIGSFNCLNDDGSSIGYIAQQFLCDACPPRSVLNRMIDEALGAALLCRRVAAASSHRRTTASLLEAVLPREARPALN